MNPWPFVTAAYLITILATLALILQSHIRMKDAERTAEALKQK